MADGTPDDTTDDAADDERLPLVAFASECALEPDRVRKFVWLGLIDPVEEHDDADGAVADRQAVAEPFDPFDGDDLATYEDEFVVVDLLDRIDNLESELRTLRPVRDVASGRTEGEDRS